MPIVRSDARQIPLADESIDLIVTSPPYWSMRAYQDQGSYMQGQIGQETTPKMFVQQLRLATLEMMRVLKPTGSIFVNLGDKYAGSGGHNNMTLGPSAKSTLQNPHYGRKVSAMFRSPPQGGRLAGGKVDRADAVLRDAPLRYNMHSDGVRPKSLMGLPWRYALMCIDDLDLILRAEIIWAKLSCIPESVKDRVWRNHEQIFHFTKQGNYYARDAEAAGAERWQRSTWVIGPEPMSIPEQVEDLPEHYAAYPPKLVRSIILRWCPSGGVVLDPFGGTGTTAGVAQTCDRVGLSFDLSADYCRLAEHRLAHQFAQIGLPL